MRDGKGYSLCHRWMVQQNFIDFLRGDFLATAIDDLPYSAHEKQIGVSIEVTEISCLEPIACKSGVGRSRIAIIAGGDACSPDYDLACPTAGQQSTPFAHDGDVQARRYADRTCFAPMRW